MCTGSAKRSSESYQTAFGTGHLFWLGGMLEHHFLPGVEPAVSLMQGASGSPSTVTDLGERSELALLLETYFTGEDVEFPRNLPRTRGQATAFGLALETALARVGYGETISYGELAATAGFPGAHRAAGSWLARNPLPVIVPCHRVIRNDGCIGRYSGGNGWKRRLLELEGAIG